MYYSHVNFAAHPGLIRPFRAFLLLVILALACPLSGRAHSAIEPIDRPRDAHWQGRHSLINQRVAETGAQAQVLFIGDSIVHGWETEGKEIWNRYYASRHALNLGIGGDETQHVLWRLTHGNLDGLSPKVVVLMLGGNNLEHENNTEEQTVEGMAAIIAVLRANLPQAKIFLHPIFPFGENLGPLRGRLAATSEVLRRFADGEHVIWIDFNYRFISDRGLLSRTLQFDYCHLTEAGFRIWAEEIEAQLAAALGDTPVAKIQP
jgi:lysophospholipase L1-like esterase